MAKMLRDFEVKIKRVKSEEWETLEAIPLKATSLKAVKKWAMVKIANDLNIIEIRINRTGYIQGYYISHSS